MVGIRLLRGRSGKKRETIQPDSTVYCHYKGVPVIAKIGQAKANGSSFLIPIEKKCSHETRFIPSEAHFDHLTFNTKKQKEKLKKSLRNRLAA